MVKSTAPPEVAVPRSMIDSSSVVQALPDPLTHRVQWFAATATAETLDLQVSTEDLCSCFVAGSAKEATCHASQLLGPSVEEAAAVVPAA